MKQTFPDLPGWTFEIDEIPSSQRLDLDWARFGLLKLVATAPASLRIAVEAALTGDERLVVREDGSRYSEVRYLAPERVKTISAELSTLDPSRLIASSGALTDWRGFLGTSEVPDDAAEYYRVHLNALITFLRDAASQDCATISWWE